MTTEQKSSDDWDLYWAHGYLTSCANAFPGNYEGQIRAVWEQFFAELDSGARLLDLATGNGAIALLAANYAIANQRNFEIHGIDRARINPAAAWQGDPAVLEAGAASGARPAAERTGFPAAHFSAVTGQYALEYTDIPATLKELARILAPGGRGRFVMHHPDSVVIQTGREETGHGELLFRDTHLFEKAEALLRCIMTADSPEALARLAKDPDAQAARTALNEAAARIGQAIEATSEPDLLTTALGYVGRAIEERAALGAEQTLALLSRGRREIEANLARLGDLLSAAVYPEQMLEIQSLMKKLGLQPGAPETLSYTHEGRPLLMGWLLDIRAS